MYAELVEYASDVYARLKRWLSWVSGEVNFAAMYTEISIAALGATSYSNAAGAAITAILADATKVFPDPLTRPLLVAALEEAEAWLKLPTPTAPATVAA